MPEIEVSCPSCGTLNIVEMDLQKRNKIFSNDFLPIETLLDLIDDILEQYRFKGEIKCSKCDKNIVASLVIENEKPKPEPQNNEKPFFPTVPLGGWPL